MLVVSDTTAITNLAAINQLELLHSLYGDIVVPEAVKRELVDPGIDNPGSIEVQTKSWLVVYRVMKDSVVTQLLSDYIALDVGEAEAIALAMQIAADLLLIDDGEGRRIAKELGLTITGLLGVLLDAKEQALIPAVRPLLNDLIEVAGFYMTTSLYAYVLQLANE